jgi:hypothetical protein
MGVGRILNEKLMVGVVTEIECSICKQTYFPDNSDISLNGNQYYKNCKECRKHILELKRNSILRRREGVLPPCYN